MALVNSVSFEKVKNLSIDICPGIHWGHQWSFPADPYIAPCFLHRLCNNTTLASHDRLSVYTRQSWGLQAIWHLCETGISYALDMLLQHVRFW